MKFEKLESDDRSNMIHDVALYVDQEGESPAQEFLKATPAKVNSLMWSIAFAVAEAPPKRFSGGGYWESMRGSMVGWYEIRVDGPRKKLHYRLFCVLDYWALDVDSPLLVIVTGLVKGVDSVFTEKQYEQIKRMGNDYFESNPRRK